MDLINDSTAMNTLEAFNQALFLLINGTTATPGGKSTPRC
jgi:hypothetical protein